MDLKELLSSEDIVTQRIAKSLEWIQTTLGPGLVDGRIEAQIKLRGETLVETFDTISAGSRADLFGWHLYNCHAYFFDQPNYDTNAGCRIVSTMAALGGRVALLEGTPGAAERLKEVADGKADFEKTLFEFLVAASYAAAGWKPELLKASGVGRTPDIRATVEGKYVYIECKRLSKSSGYALSERERWMVLVKPLSKYLAEEALPVLLDIVFHKEVERLPETFLADVLIPKLRLAIPGTVIDSGDLRVILRPVDLAPLQRELETVNLKTNGTRLNYLLFGGYDPALGYHSLFYGNMDECHPLFIETIDFAAGVSWSCDAPRAMASKARDIRNRLRDAIDQLPDDEAGIVHVAVESYDGPVVERIRNERITRTLNAFRGRKQLRFVHVHLLSFESPPDEAWAAEEAVYSTSFAPGRGATAREHEESPYRLKRHHVWSFDEAVSTFAPFKGIFGQGKRAC